jgi:hypothetical protein
VSSQLLVAIILVRARNAALEAPTTLAIVNCCFSAAVNDSTAPPQNDDDDDERLLWAQREWVVETNNPEQATAKMVAENPHRRSAPALEEGKDSAVVNMQQDDAMEPSALDAAARDHIRVSKSLSKIFWFPYMRDQKIYYP